MDAQRKRELKQAYLSSKPDMGVFSVECGGQTWIGWSKNLKATFNGLEFRLQTGSYINRPLQDSYRAAPETLRLERLALLEYDADERKTDYTADLTALQDIWLEQRPDALPL